MNRFSHFLSFDVESIGLMGAGFAWGSVLMGPPPGCGTMLISKPVLLEERICIGDPQKAAAEEDWSQAEDWNWVKDNVLPTLPAEHENMVGDPWDMSPGQVRREFFVYWRDLRRKYGSNLAMVVDCGFPVEANFLTKMFAENGGPTDLLPYPVIDVSNLLWLQGHDPTGERPRLRAELPCHNPLNDARQTYRILTEAWGAQR